MKKNILIVVAVLFSTLLFAEVLESKYSYVSYPIYKILLDKRGYVILTPNANRTMNRVYVPLEWFGGKVGKAKLQKMQKKLSPTLTVYYKEGVFEWVKIVVPLNRGDVVWGILPQSENSAAKFTQDTLTIE